MKRKDIDRLLSQSENSFVETVSREAVKVNTLSFDYLGGNDVMPIGGWWGPYHNIDRSLCDLSEERFYKMLADCGINLITVSRDDYAENDENVLQALTFAEKYRLGIFVHDTDYVKINDLAKLSSATEFFYKYPCCVGFHVFDEPTPDRFDGIGEFYNMYSRLNIGDKVLYTNLYPIYGENVFKKFNLDYDKYLSEFMEKVPTKFLSYDYYPFYFRGEGTSGAKKYFYNLSLAKHYADKYDVPLWAFLQAGGQWQCVNSPSIDYYPSESEMLWNASTCLAFGVKALHYFTLIQPEEYTPTDTGKDFRRIGLIGFDGNKNCWYDYAKRINEHIASVDEILMHSQNLGIICNGEVSDSVISDEYKIKTFRELVSIGGDEAVIGCFDCKGKSAFYIVNNSTTSNGKIILTFDEVRKFDLYVNAEKHTLCNREIVLDTEAGEGVMIILH